MRLPRPRVLLVSATLAVALLTGCGTDTTPSSSPSDDGTGVEESDLTPTEPTTSEAATTPEEPTSSTGSGSGSGSGLEARLLTAAEVPGVNQETVWEVASTEPEGTDTAVTCQRFSLVDIGAQEAVLREFEAEGDVSGVQLVGTFADEQSANRAHAVLRTWLTTCAETLDSDIEKVSPLHAVEVGGGSGESVVVQYGDADDELHVFAGVGVTQVGNLLSVVEVTVEGMDYNYEPGQEPAARAVTAAAARLS